MNILKIELEILNFFTEAYEKDPKELRKNLLNIPVWKRAKVLELEILNFFTEAYEKDPKELRKNLLNIPFWKRAKVLAFIKSRIPELHKNIEKLIYGAE